MMAVMELWFSRPLLSNDKSLLVIQEAQLIIINTVSISPKIPFPHNYQEGNWAKFESAICSITRGRSKSLQEPGIKTGLLLLDFKWVLMLISNKNFFLFGICESIHYTPVQCFRRFGGLDKENKLRSCKRRIQGRYSRIGTQRWNKDKVVIFNLCAQKDILS